MNNYEDAIKRENATHFLLGKEEYFVLNRDWGGHDITSTQEDLWEYSKMFGEENLYVQLNTDIQKILEEEVISLSDLKNILAIFWWYFINRKEEEKLKGDWIISPIIKELLVKKINSAEHQNEDLRNLIQRIKERFNYELS